MTGRGRDWGDYITETIAGLIASVILAIIGGWLFMICLGAAHSFDEGVPNLSYGASFFVALAIHIASDMRPDDA